MKCLVNKRDRKVENYESVVSQSAVYHNYLKSYLYNTYLTITCVLVKIRIHSLSSDQLFHSIWDEFVNSWIRELKRCFLGLFFSPSPLYSVNSVNIFSGLTISGTLYPLCHKLAGRHAQSYFLLDSYPAEKMSLLLP